MSDGDSLYPGVPHAATADQVAPVASESMANRSPEWRWNFSLCPPSEEEECYLFEYLHEATRVRDAFARWKKSEPLIGARQGNFISRLDFELWARGWRARRPDELARLDGALFYLVMLFADFFPEIHWLEIEEVVRKKRLQFILRWTPVLDVTGVRDERLIQEMIVGQCEPAQAGGDGDLAAICAGIPVLAARLPVQLRALLINWKFPKEKLRAELIRWFDAEFKKWSAAADRREITETGKNTPVAWLKFLAARRLMHAYGNNVERCVDESRTRWREPLKAGKKSNSKRPRAVKTAPIYQPKKDSWERAAHRATDHVQYFERLVGPAPQE